MIIAAAWGKVTSNADALADRVSRTEQVIETLKDERTEILVAIKSVEERVKAVQDQLTRHNDETNFRRPVTRTSPVQP